jgi:antitoxin ParD1/3/4
MCREKVTIRRGEVNQDGGRADVVSSQHLRGPTMKTYQITLPDEFAAFVDRVLAEGKWDTVDYLMMAALVALQDQQDLGADLDQEWLRREIQKGIDSADRGELVDGPTVMARLKAKLDAAASAKATTP